VKAEKDVAKGHICYEATIKGQNKAIIIPDIAPLAPIQGIEGSAPSKPCAIPEKKPLKR